MNQASPVDVLFFAALELATEEERIAYLDSACGGDAELRRQVEKMLHAHANLGDFLQKPAVDQLAAAPAPADATEAFDASTDNKEPLMTRTEGAGSNNDQDTPLDFLQPSSRADSLGRIGHYEILQILGKGGFGIVFRAFDELLQRVVALKVLAPSLAATSPARKRFLREAQSSAKVRHENVVHIYAVEDQPLPYLVMEFVPGETLQQRLDRIGPLEVPEILNLGRQIAEGLAAAHATGLIHRDIKPGNVLIEPGPQGRVKITDFGLARAADDASLTQSGVLAGTPMYMAPEQARGETLDPRADLFSLGSVLYYMAAGRPPFRASSTFGVLKRVVEDTPRPIRELIPETPQWLADIIAKLHAKKPEERFQSAREVADVLADCEAKLKAKQEVKSVVPSAAEPAGRKWVAAAALLLLPVLALAVTEFAGLTHLLRQQPTTEPIKPGTNPAPVVDAREPPPFAVAPFSAAQARKHQEDWAKHLGVPVEFTNSLGMTFRLIPPGEFQMGIDLKDVDTSKWNTPADWPAIFLGEHWPREVTAASPRHPVKLTRAFYIQTHEVRHGWYRKMMGAIPELDPAADADSPVMQFVSWPDTIAFCNALSKHEGRRPSYLVDGDNVSLTPDGNGYRLPTEAEWEFACRGGTVTPWFFGDSPLQPDLSVFKQYISTDWGGKARKANPFGLFDMYAGSTEWVWDGYEPYRPDAVVDPVVAPGQNPRVMRGSSSYDHAGRAFWTVNSFYRWSAKTYTQRGGFVGFGRVVISVPLD
jgi:serine/threonine protein kinase